MEENKTFKLDSSKKTRYLLPNILTLGGVCLGISSIKFSIDGNYSLAVIFILLAAILDALDGRIARLIKGTSEFGKELDSLTDFVSFGIAPVFILYFWELNNYGKLGWAITLIYSVCCALRLARFNASKPDIQGQCFIGLATPAAAAVIASIIIAFEDLFGSRVHPGFMVAVVYILAFLMVSNIKYPAFKKFEFRKRVSFTRFLLVVLVLYILATIPKIALFIISFGYTIFGPIGEWSSRKANLNTISDSIKHPENN